MPVCPLVCVWFSPNYGRYLFETELADAFGTIYFIGTLPENVVDGLEQLGYRSRWFENATLEHLQDLLAHNWPVIAFLRASELPHGVAGLHAVVVVEIQKERVTCLDPSLDHGLLLDSPVFLRAWAGFGNQGLVVWI